VPLLAEYHRAVARVLLIVNPFASAVTSRRLADVADALGEAGTVETVLTQGPGHAIELAAAASGYDAIVAYSGDGGYNEVLNGADGSAPLGFVPGGGTSVLARALGLSRDAYTAAGQVAEALLQGRGRRISLGRVNGRRFGFNAGIGFDAEAVRRMDLRGRSQDGKRPGDLTFAWTLVRMFAERKLNLRDQLEIEGYGRGAFLLVANCDPYTYAGSLPLRLVPDAEFELGLDFVAPAAVRPGSLPRLAARALRGKLPEAPEIHAGHDLERFSARCDVALPLQADGEDLGDVEEAVFEAERDAITVLA
jgi:diacylglycerol kinase family enzyme